VIEIDGIKLISPADAAQARAMRDAWVRMAQEWEEFEPGCFESAHATRVAHGLDEIAATLEGRIVTRADASFAG